MGCCAKCGCVINSGVYCEKHKQWMTDSKVEVKSEIDPAAVAIVSFLIGVVVGVTAAVLI